MNPELPKNKIFSIWDLQLKPLDMGAYTMRLSTFSDDYIIRIYRYSSTKTHRFIGTIEEVGVEGKLAFETIEELWDILARKERNPDKEYEDPDKYND